MKSLSFEVKINIICSSNQYLLLIGCRNIAVFSILESCFYVLQQIRFARLRKPVVKFFTEYKDMKTRSSYFFLNSEKCIMDLTWCIFIRTLAGFMGFFCILIQIRMELETFFMPGLMRMHYLCSLKDFK